MVSTVHKKGNGYLLPVDGMEDHMPDLLSIPAKKKKKKALVILASLFWELYPALTMTQ